MKKPWIVAAAIAAGGIGMVASGGTEAMANGQAPGGNNGTIKIEAGPPDTDKANEPHVSCQVYVEFWGYDAGSQQAELIFDAQAPTSGGTVLRDTASWTTAKRDGGRHLDHTYGPAELAKAFESAGIAPAKQGYHVKLTVHVTGSKGADTKHKVFWLEPCDASPATTSTTAASTTTTAAPVTTSSTVGSRVLGTDSGRPGSDPAKVLGVGGTTAVLSESMVASSATPDSIDAVLAAGLGDATQARPTKVLGAGGKVSSGGALPRTGIAVGGLSVLGGALLGLGALLKRSGRTLALRRS